VRQAGPAAGQVQRQSRRLPGRVPEALGHGIHTGQENGIIIVSVPEGECGCPLVDATRTPAFWCNCSVGYQKESFETMFGRQVQVALKESKLAGGTRCVFAVRL
jgi:hypothetical protein